MRKVFLFPLLLMTACLLLITFHRLRDAVADRLTFAPPGQTTGLDILADQPDLDFTLEGQADRQWRDGRPCLAVRGERLRLSFVCNVRDAVTIELRLTMPDAPAGSVALAINDGVKTVFPLAPPRAAQPFSPAMARQTLTFAARQGKNHLDILLRPDPGHGIAPGAEATTTLVWGLRLRPGPSLLGQLADEAMPWLGRRPAPRPFFGPLTSTF